jgi:hypothetical protein
MPLATVDGQQNEALKERLLRGDVHRLGAGRRRRRSAAPTRAALR